MSTSSIALASLISAIKAFNSQVRSRPTYDARKAIRSTPVLFHNNLAGQAPPLRKSPNGWATIPRSLAAVLAFPAAADLVTQFSSSQDEGKINDPQFMNDAGSSSKLCLQQLALFVIELHCELAQIHPPSVQARVRQAAEELKHFFIGPSQGLAATSNIYQSIRKRIREARRCHSERPISSCSSLEQRNQRLRKVLQLRSEGNLTASEICRICRISKSTFHNYVRMERNHEARFVKKSGQLPGIGHLSEQDKQAVKALADDPHHSYSVPSICAQLESQLGRPFPRRHVYTCLSQDLHYTFKRNSFITPASLGPVQTIIRYRVCRVLLDALVTGKQVICMDESGFVLGEQHPYSYSPKGMKPYRIGSSRSVRLNLTMAISKHGVFACQARFGESNEMSFISFICAVAERLLKTPGQSPQNVLLYLDNHSSHTSQLSMQLLGMIGVKVLFAPVSFYHLNPIEGAFSLIKRRLWNKTSTNL